MEHHDADPAGGFAVQRFNDLWDEHAGRVLAYATRHLAPEAAQDVLSETFLVAWRRLGDVPDDALPWLLVVARNTVANHRRTHRRQASLHSRLEVLEGAARFAPGPDVTVSDRAEVLAKLAALSETEREALLLVAWDGLTASEAAHVAGCSTATFNVRLFRARRRLQAETTPTISHGLVAQPSGSSS